MPLFSSANAFDANVEKATNEKNTTEDWGVIMEICDDVKRQKNGAKDCMKSIHKRLTSKAPIVVLQALTLLDACVNNCDRAFRLEVCSKDFMQECHKLMNNKSPKVAQKMRFLVKKWAELPEIKNDPNLSQLPKLYGTMKKEGKDFSDPDVNPQAGPKQIPIYTLPPANNLAAQEEDDFVKAIALSLEQAEQEEQSKRFSVYPPVPSPSPLTRAQDDGKHVTFDANQRKVLYTVKALYDFEAAEDNELTFQAGEFISVTDDSDVNWWKGFNARGEGLFPTNFITADLSVEPEPSQKLIGASSVTLPEKVEIDELRINEALLLLQNADPTGETRPDSQEMLNLEALCHAMGPLIDMELQSVDKECTQMLELNRRVRDALQMYYSLMNENPAYCGTVMPAVPPMTPPQGQPQAQQQQQQQPGSPFSGPPSGGMGGQPMYGGEQQQQIYYQGAPPSPMDPTVCSPPSTPVPQGMTSPGSQPAGIPADPSAPSTGQKDHEEAKDAKKGAKKGSKGKK